MKYFFTLTFFIFLFLSQLIAQPYKVNGKITDKRGEALPYVTLQISEIKSGTVSKIDGTYELMLGAGKYDLVFSMVGYKTQIANIIVRNEENLLNIILEEDDSQNLSEVVIRSKFTDRSEEIIKNVIRNKEAIKGASGPYSCEIYIKALQEDSFAVKQKSIFSKKTRVITEDPDNELSRMTMAEIVLKYDQGAGNQIKEERLAVP